MFSKLQAGQQTLGKTRAGSIVGYGVDLTLSLTEGIVEKVLPSDESEEEEKEEDEDSKGQCVCGCRFIIMVTCSPQLLNLLMNFKTISLYVS